MTYLANRSMEPPILLHSFVLRVLSASSIYVVKVLRKISSVSLIDLTIINFVAMSNKLVELLVQELSCIEYLFLIYFVTHGRER